MNSVSKAVFSTSLKLYPINQVTKNKHKAEEDGRLCNEEEIVTSVLHYP